MKMKTLIFSAFFIFFTSTLFAAQSLNSVAAVVNNNVITQSDLNTAVTQAKQEILDSRMPNPPGDAKLRSMVLQQLIERQLQLELADNAHITVSDSKVMETVSRIAAQNHLTIDQMKQKLEQRGLSFGAYKKNILEQLRMQQIQDAAVGNQIQVTPADIHNARVQYQAQMNTQQQLYHLIDIINPTQLGAQKIVEQLKGGTNIDEFSNNSKDLGWQTTNTLPALFVNALTKMSPGDVAGPLQAPNGFHVLKLIGLRGNQTSTPTKAQLQNIAYQIKMQKAVQQWLEKIRKTAYIKIT